METKWIKEEVNESDIAYRIKCGGEQVFDVWRSSEPEETDKVASMATAAPDMYKSLSILVDVLDGYYGILSPAAKKELDEAKAALKKATE